MVVILNDKDVVSRLIITLGKAGIKERVNQEGLDEGVGRIDDLLERLSYCRPPFVQGIGDDFMPDSRLYDAIGALYPILERDKKNQVLTAFFRQLYGIRDDHVQTNHTAYIREPLLLAELGGIKRVWWPGTDDVNPILSKHESFDTLRSTFMNGNGLFKVETVKSDFVMGYALLRNENRHIAEKYAECANPEFLDRVVQGYVWWYMHIYGRSEDTGGEKRRAKVPARLKEFLPAVLHKTVDEHVSGQGWADYTQFH